MFHVKYLRKITHHIPSAKMGRVAAAWKRRYQWCVFLTQKKTLKQFEE